MTMTDAEYQQIVAEALNTDVELYQDGAHYTNRGSLFKPLVIFLLLLMIVVIFGYADILSGVWW